MDKRIPAIRVFSPFQVAITAFFFGPLAGGIMSGLDYKRFKKGSWLGVLLLPTVIQLVAILLFIIFFPKSELPAYVFPAFSAVTYYLYQRGLYSYLPFQKLPETILKTLLYGFLGANLLYLPFVLLFGTEQSLELISSLT